MKKEIATHGTEETFEPDSLFLTMPTQVRTSRRHRSRTSSDRGLDYGLWTIITGFLRVVASASVIAVLCLSPWFYGGVEFDTQLWLTAILLTGLGCWTVAAFITIFLGKNEAARLPTLLVPLMCALMLGTFQLSPSLAGIFRSNVQIENQVERHDHSIRAMLPATFKSNSLYPAATRLEVARIGIAIIACFLGCVLFQEPRRQIWLWSSVTINGAALSFFGIVQFLSWNGKLFWTVPLLLGGQPFASYVNRNNAAGYLNLCLAAGCGVLLWTRMRPKDDLTSESDGKNHREHRQSMFDGSIIASVLLAAMVAAGILCSASRGGILAMLVAGTVCFLMIARSRHGALSALVLTCILGLGIGLVCWTGLHERIIGRWNQTAGDTVAIGAQTRLANWRDAMHAVEEYPILGTGFGTYGYAYLPYQSWLAGVRFYNADNQFVEGLVEGGVIGLCLMLIAIGMVLAAAVSLFRSRQNDAIGLLGVFAIVSQVVSSFFDFGPTMYANMVTLAVVCGAITGRSANLSSEGLTLAKRLQRFPLLKLSMVGFIGLGLLGYGILGVREMQAAADCRIAWRGLPKRLDSPTVLNELQIEAAIQQLATALHTRPDDADANVALANLYIYRYRHQAFESLMELHRHGGRPANWSLTDPGVLYQQISQFHQNGNTQSIEQIRQLDVVRQNLIPARRHLAAAQRSCPLMPDIDITLAVLSRIADDDLRSVDHSLRRAIALAPVDPVVLDRCAVLARTAGLHNLAVECWRLCLAADSTRFSDLRRRFPQSEMSDEQLLELLPESADVLLKVALENFSADASSETRHQLAHRAERLLAAQPVQASQSRLRDQARIHRLLDDSDLAIEEYRQVLAESPLNVDWRLEFAELLESAGQFHEALDQAELALSQQPHNARSRQLIHKLHERLLRPDPSGQ